MRQRICFVVPKYQASADTHFDYLHKLIFLLEKEMDIFLIIEEGDRPDFFKNTRVYVQKFRILPLRFVENFLTLLFVKLSGYRDFYVHYSFLSAFDASLITGLSGRTFYWNCGLPWLYRRNFLRDRFERLVYRLVTFLVTGTEGLKKEYARHYQLPVSKIKVLPNWIDTARFQLESGDSNELKSRLNISQNQKVILFIHRLSRRKGADYLPEIIKNLDSIIHNSTSVILVIGDGPERRNIELRIRNYGLGDKVRFLGCVPNKEVQDYFGIADLFIMPSEEEGFPHVLLEAMASGMPFVTFDVGGVKEISPPELFKYLVTSGNLNDFVEKIKELLYTDLKYLEALKQSELKWVQQFDIKFAVERFIRLLK